MINSNTKYMQLQKALTDELSSGNFSTGARFYTEKELMAKYCVSSATVSRTLNEMTALGYFQRKRKLGTFVLESPDIPGMCGKVMTKPLYINKSLLENTTSPSWFVIDEIRRGVINTYPGTVKIVDIDEIMQEKKKDPSLIAVIYPQSIEFFQEKYAIDLPQNSVLITLPPNLPPKLDSVYPNYLVGVFEAMEHLISLGHTRIAFLGRRSMRNRYAAYRISLETYMIKYDPRLDFTEETLLDSETAYAVTSRILSGSICPTAIMAGTDKLALGAARAAMEAGLKIPEDLSIVGFDNIEAASKFDIPLSTVTVPYYELGKNAILLLIDKLKNRMSIPSKTIMSKFINRQSTGRAKVM